MFVFAPSALVGNASSKMSWRGEVPCSQGGHLTWEICNGYTADDEKNIACSEVWGISETLSVHVAVAWSCIWQNSKPNGNELIDWLIILALVRFSAVAGDRGASRPSRIAPPWYRKRLEYYVLASHMCLTAAEKLRPELKQRKPIRDVLSR